MSAKLRWFFLTFLAVVVLDQVTKYWVVQNIELWRGQISVIDGLFMLVHYRNKGAVGGMLGDSPYRLHVFLVFTVVALSAIGWMVRELPPKDRFVAFCLGLIAGGAVGNAIDRTLLGEVVDFLRFYTVSPSLVQTLRGYNLPAEYPSFNVADMGIVIGVIVFFIQQFYQDHFVKEPELSADEIPDEDASPA